MLYYKSETSKVETSVRIKAVLQKKKKLQSNLSQIIQKVTPDGLPREVLNSFQGEKHSFGNLQNIHFFQTGN